MANRKRTTEERIAEVDEKIDFYNKKINEYEEKIKMLQQKKEDILNPKPRKRKRKMSFNTVASIAQEKGMTLEEFVDKLGIEIDSNDVIK